MIVRRATPDPIEWVVRGHIAGSGWKEYQQSQTICGIPLPSGLSLAEQLPEPIVTPTTKHEDHDRPLTPAEARDLVGSERWEHGKALCLDLFNRGREELAPFSTLTERIRAKVTETFGAQKLWLAAPTFFSKIAADRPPRIENDEYWHPHVDTLQYGSFTYTALLYLSSAGAGVVGRLCCR